MTNYSLQNMREAFGRMEREARLQQMLLGRGYGIAYHLYTLGTRVHENARHPDRPRVHYAVVLTCRRNRMCYELP